MCVKVIGYCPLSYFNKMSLNAFHFLKCTKITQNSVKGKNAIKTKQCSFQVLLITEKRCQSYSPTLMN